MRPHPRAPDPVFSGRLRDMPVEPDATSPAAPSRAADPERAWVTEAIRRLEADANRSADTHLHVFPLPRSWGVDLYLKDESVHPTGSLKHRLARSLVLYGLANGDITEGTVLVDATSGSTAISEAYFAAMLGLEFVAVVPRGTTQAKLDLIERAGGRCDLVERPDHMYAEAERLGAQPGYHYLDQFGRASVVTDWRGNNNIACSIFEQMAMERHPEPTWIVVGAGTGGTSATIGRYCRYRRTSTRLAVIDEMIRVEDAASVAAMRTVERVIGRRVGASTGTNLVGALELAVRMRDAGETGSVVTLICDGGDRYASTYWDDDWVAAQGWRIASHLATLEHLLELA